MPALRCRCRGAGACHLWSSRRHALGARLPGWWRGTAFTAIRLCCVRCRMGLRRSSPQRAWSGGRRGPRVRRHAQAALRRMSNQACGAKTRTNKLEKSNVVPHNLWCPANLPVLQLEQCSRARASFGNAQFLTRCSFIPCLIRINASRRLLCAVCSYAGLLRALRPASRPCTRMHI